SGTVQYMAPEQLEGKDADHRTDIFAFGCVLYEMLAGRKAFEGPSAITVIAAITSSEPPPVPVLTSADPALDHVLRRCLEKDPERRWQNIADVAGELRWIADRPIPTPPAVATRTPSRFNRAAPVLALMLAAVAVVIGWRAVRGRPVTAELPILRFEIPTGPTDDPSMALSPDGTRIAFIANQNGQPLLWIRSLDAVESRVLPGTQGASLPFWAPDGRNLAFFAEGKLKRTDVAGGSPLVVADVSNGRGGAWNADGVILFVSNVAAPIMRVSARGGPTERVTELNSGSGSAHRLPQFLPDGKRFLFSAALGTADTNGVYIGSLDKTSPVRLLSGETGGRFAAPDKLLTINQGALQAYTFDPRSGTIQGEPSVITQGFAGAAAIVGFTVSDNGVLAYRTGAAQRRQLVWVSRQGQVLNTVGEPETDYIASPELSADEKSVVVFIQRSGDNDIWVIELTRNLARRITDGPPADAHPLWDPDGEHIVFASQRFGGGPTRQALSGGPAEPLFKNRESGVALSCTRDRRYVLIRRENAKTGADLVAASTGQEARDVVVAASQYDETEGQFSPDGSWVAFVSSDSGRPEVFVQSFPDARARTQVSIAGGTQVRWSADGKEIFYVAPDGQMMSVAIALGTAAPDVKSPVPLFQTHLGTGTNVIGNKPQYAVARDGRFLINTAIGGASAPIVVAVNWMKSQMR
ncbi:MAG TPA: protein kinase, partial [Vicinamibacterales bacterium]